MKRSKKSQKIQRNRSHVESNICRRFRAETSLSTKHEKQQGVEKCTGLNKSAQRSPTEHTSGNNKSAGSRPPDDGRRAAQLRKRCPAAESVGAVCQHTCLHQSNTADSPFDNDAINIIKVYYSILQDENDLTDRRTDVMTRLSTGLLDSG